MFTLNPATLIFDFRFDIAGALLSTNALNASVTQISQNALRAERALTSMGASMLMSMGAIPSSLMGAVGAAVTAAEKFDQTALSWANLISANKDVLAGPIQSHEQRMIAAKNIMSDLAKISREFGLSQKDLSDFSKMINANLIRKGLQGDNFETGHTMARQLLKSAPNLGIDPTMSMGQLIRAIQGGASMGDPLFRSLAADTDAMHKFSKAGGAELFNSLKAAERVRLLNDALGQFAKDSSVNKARLESLTNQLTILKDTFMGFDGILSGFGSQVKKLIVEVLNFVNKELDTNGRIIMGNIQKIFVLFAGSSEQAVVNLTQAQRLQNSMQVGKSAFGFLAHFLLVDEALKWIGGRMGTQLSVMRVVGIALGSFWAVLRTAATALAPYLMMLGRFLIPFIGPIIMGIITKVLLPVSALMGVLTTIDRAIGYARVHDAKAMPGIIAEISTWTARVVSALDMIFLPFTTGMDIIARWIAPLFQVTTAMDLMRKPMEWLVTAMEGVGAVMLHFLVLVETIGDRMGAAIFNTKDRDKGFFERMDEIFEQRVNAIQKKMDEGLITPKQEVNIARVTIENKFKENAEPDRIAFTIKDQLQKLAQNSTQAKGSPMFPAYGRP